MHESHIHRQPGSDLYAVGAVDRHRDTTDAAARRHTFAECQLYNITVLP